MLGIAYLTAFIVCGILIMGRLLSRTPLLIRLWLGTVAGLVMVMWLPSLVAFFTGFTLAAQWIALGFAALGTAAVMIFAKPADHGLDTYRMPDLIPMAAVIIPAMLLMTYLHYTHTLRPGLDGLHVGQSTYGDLNLHMDIIMGLRGAAYPPDYTILPGARLGYPFLVDALSSSMVMLGTELRFAMILPNLLLTLVVFVGVWVLCHELAPGGRVLVLAFALIFLNGGLGFIYTFDLAGDAPGKLRDVFNEFYMTPANLPNLNLRWSNLLADLLLPQRTFLAGWAVVMPALWLLLRAQDVKKRALFVMLGVLAGAMPMIHTHSFLALGLFSVALMIWTLITCERGTRDRRFIDFLIFGGIALMIALPQLMIWTFHQSGAEGFIKMRFNWVNNTGSHLRDNYFWFWIKNLGVQAFMIIPMLFDKDKRTRMVAVCASPIFVFAEIVQLQPNEYDNNKLFYIWYVLMMALVAGYLIKLYDRLRGLGGRRLLAAGFVLAAVTSGVLSIGREIVSDYLLIGDVEVRAAAYIEVHALPRATVLTGTQHNNAVSTLTGRYIVCGPGNFLSPHGLNYGQNQHDVELMYTDPEAAPRLFADYGVDYIYVSDHERHDYEFDEAWFSDQYPLIFEEDSVSVYIVSERAKTAAQGALTTSPLAGVPGPA